MRIKHADGFSSSHLLVICVIAAAVGFFMYNSNNNGATSFDSIVGGDQDPPALSALAHLMDERQTEREQNLNSSASVNLPPKVEDRIPPFDPQLTAVRADFLVGTDRRGKKEFDEELFVTIKFYVREKNLKSVQILRNDDFFMNANPQPVSKKKGNQWLFFETRIMRLPNTYVVVCTDVYDQTHKKVYHLRQPKKKQWVYQPGPRHYTLKLSRTDNPDVDNILMRMGPRRTKRRTKAKTSGSFPQSSRTF